MTEPPHVPARPLSTLSDTLLGQPPPPDEATRIVGSMPSLGARLPWRDGIGRLGPVALSSLVAAALVGNLALHTGLSSVASLVAVVAAITTLWHAGCLSQTRSHALVVGALLVAVWLPLRDSSWLTALNSLTCCALIVAAVVFDAHPPPRLSLRSIGDLAARATAVLVAPILVLRSLPVLSMQNRARSKGPALAVARGLAIAAFPVLVLGAILAQADAVFASALNVDLQAGGLFRHGMIAAAVGLSVAGLICVGRVGESNDPGRPGLLGGVEIVTVLGCLFLLFGAFTAAQVVGALSNLDTLLAAQGLTHAEYARSGFFQLLTVAALTLLILGVLQAIARPCGALVDSLRRFLGAAVCLLTVLIVLVAILRLDLYVDAFGQTTLRWYSTAFAWLLGVVFGLFAFQHMLARERSWFSGAALGATVAALLIVNAVNPEHRVATHNLNHEATESNLDAWYLFNLSADAWPVLIEHADQLISNGNAGIQNRLLPRDLYENRCVQAGEQPGWGPAGFNLARYRLVCKTERG